MTREEAIQQQIDDIMDNFDVERCVKVMEYLNWDWFVPGSNNMEIPDEATFRRSLRNALKSTVLYGGYMSGGFSFELIDRVDPQTGEPFVRFRGGFYIEDVSIMDGISYKTE